MGLTDILHDLRVKFFGYNENDIYNFLAYPKKSELIKLLRDKRSREQFFSTVEQIVQKRGLNSAEALEAVSKYILQKAKDNELIRFDTFKTPTLQDYAEIIGLDELGRYAFNEKDPGMGVVRVITVTNVGKKIEKKDYDKFVANVRNSVAMAYQVHDTVERIERALDIASDVSLALGLGGLAVKGGLWVGKRVLKDVIKESLARSLIVRTLNGLAGLGIKAGDIAFASSELGKATLNTVAKGLPLTYSLDHILFSGLAFTGLLGSKTKTGQEIIRKMEGAPVKNIDDIKTAIIEEQVDLGPIEYKPSKIANLFTNQLITYLENKSGRKLSLEALDALNVHIVRVANLLQDKVNFNTLILADAINEKTKYSHKINKIYQEHRAWLEYQWDKIFRLLGKLPDEQVILVNQDYELFEFFSMNTSKALYNRIINTVEDLKGQGVELDKVLIKVDDEIVAFNGAQVYSNDFMKLIDDYVRKSIRDGRIAVGVEFLDEAGQSIMEIGLPSVYIPTSDYKKVMRVLIEDEEGFKDIFVDIPRVLLGAIAERFKGDVGKIHNFLKEYVAKVKGLDIEKVHGIMQIYDPATQLFPSTIIRELTLSQYRLLDEILGIFPDEELKQLGLRKEWVTKLTDLAENLATTFNQQALRFHKIQIERSLKEIRSSLKEILGREPSDRTRTVKLLEEALKKSSINNDEELANLVSQFAQVIQEYKARLTDIKGLYTDKEKAKLAERLTRIFQKTDTLIEKLSKEPIKVLKEKLIHTLAYKHPSEFKRYGSGFVDVELLAQLDKDLALDYLARAYTRPWTTEVRWLLNIARNVDEIVFDNPILKDTDFAKTLRLVRDYQGTDTPRSKWFKVLGTISKIYTMFLPRVAIGAGVQLFSAISQRYPSFRFFQAPLETIKEILTNPELRDYLAKQLKEKFEEPHYLSFWIRAVEPFVQTIFYNELMKNPKFREEVLKDFGQVVTRFTPADAKLLAEFLTNLIDSPTAISPFVGATLGKLAYIQSWFPYVVAPFQVALQSFAKSLTSPNYAMNFFKHLIIGSTILPATVTQFSAVADTIRNTYEGLATIYHTMASILTGNPEPIQSYLEKQEPILASIWKSVFSNLADIPRDELNGRLFHDLGLVLALHGDDVAWEYVRSGLNFLERHLDLANKNLFSPGSVSTSFEVTVPVVNTAIRLLTSLFVYEKEQPQQAGRSLLELLMQTLPIAKNIKAGILNELTKYGRISEDSILKYFDDEDLAKTTGLAYFLGVMISHPIAVAKIFDTMFLGGFGEAVGRVFTGEEKKLLFLPKVTDAKSYRLKVLGNEEYILRSLNQLEDPLTKKNILLRFTNVINNYFDEKKAKKTDRTIEEEISMFKSYLTFLTYDPSLLDDTELRYMIEVANRSAYYFKVKYGLEEKDLQQFLAKALDELKIRTKLRERTLPPEKRFQGS